MMEILDVLYDLMSLVFVLGTMISMGLSLTVAQFVGPLKNLRFVIMALLVNFVVAPVAAYVLTLVIPLDEALVTGLILVSLAAGAPALPKLAEIAKVDTAAATGSDGAADRRHHHHHAHRAALAADRRGSHLHGHCRRPDRADADSPGGQPVCAGALGIDRRIVQPYAAQASTISLLFLIVLMLVLNWSNVVSLFGSGGLLASLILVVIALAGGYLLGGPGASQSGCSRWAPGSATSPRPWWSPR